MANFVYIKDNEIKRYEDSLPENWKNVSNFHHAKDNDDFINSYGWFRVSKIHVEYDTKTQYISGYTYKITEKNVEETPTISDIVFPSLEERTEVFLRNIRERRNQLLSMCDWTQMPDLQLTKSDDWKLSWQLYRQALRDFPNICDSLEPIDDIQLLDWPKAPEE